MRPVQPSHAPCDCPRCQAEAEFSPLGFGIFTPDESQDEAVAIHVIPGNDIAVHVLNDEGDCACNPAIDEEADGLLYMHNAFDQRELFLQGFRKVS